MVAAPAWAEWVTAGETDTSTYYIDPATIRKDGDLRRVWQVTDLKKRGPTGNMSSRFLSEFDCKGERYRFLNFSTHSNPKATGKTLETSDAADNWKAVPPDTVAWDVLKAVCAK
jgi:hypothetical protein